jgi:hypothetical protein
VTTLTGLGEATRVEKKRSVEFLWKLYDKESDFSRESNKAVYAKLRVGHNKAGANYFSGEYTTEDYFDVSLSNVERADMLDGDGNRIGQVEGFTLFKGVRVARYEAGKRFSRKRLLEAADRALAEFTALYESGNSQVLAYFEGRG